MKFYAVFAVLVASISTLSGTEAFLEPIVEGAIENVRQTLRNLGLDPVYIKREQAGYALPVPSIFRAMGLMEEVRMIGVSDIVINSVEYNILSQTLDFDLEIPQIHVSAGYVFGEATILNNEISGEGSGSVDVYNARVKGSATMSLAGDIQISTMEIDSSIGSIDSNIRLVLLGFDISDTVNTALGESLLNLLEAFKPEIDELLAIVATDFINNRIPSQA